MTFSHICDLIEANQFSILATCVVVVLSTLVVYYRDKAHD